MTKKADTQLVLGTTEFFPPSPSLSSCEYVESFFFAARLPCLFCLAWIYLALGFPSGPSVDYEHPSFDRHPATHGASRPYRRRYHWSSRRGCRTSCRLRQSFRICRGPRQKPRIVTSIVFDHGSLSSRPRSQPCGAHAAGSQCSARVEKSPRPLASSHDGIMRRHRPTATRWIRL